MNLKGENLLDENNDFSKLVDIKQILLKDYISEDNFIIFINTIVHCK